MKSTALSLALVAMLAGCSGNNSSSSATASSAPDASASGSAPSGPPSFASSAVYGVKSVESCKSIAKNAVAAGGVTVSDATDDASPNVTIGLAPSMLVQFQCDPDGKYAFISVTGYDDVTSVKDAIAKEYVAEAKGGAAASPPAAPSGASALVSHLLVVKKPIGTVAACSQEAAGMLKSSGFGDSKSSGPITIAQTGSSLGQIFCDKPDNTLFVSMVGTSDADLTSILKKMSDSASASPAP